MDKNTVKTSTTEITLCQFCGKPYFFTFMSLSFSYAFLFSCFLWSFFSVIIYSFILFCLISEFFVCNHKSTLSFISTLSFWSSPFCSQLIIPTGLPSKPFALDLACPFSLTQLRTMTTSETRYQSHKWIQQQVEPGFCLQFVGEIIWPTW